MAKHHTVQDKYLSQWRKSDTENQLNIYVIPENDYIERGPKWKGFWKEDFNILDKDGVKSYVPEEVTSVIDSKGLEAIKRIDSGVQLSGMDRSCISFYISLQYIRTPRFREESDKMIQAMVEHFMRKDISSPDKVALSKDELLAHKPISKKEKEALEKISSMTDKEIKATIFETIQNESFIQGLTDTGHSKGILKVDRLAKEIFEVQWTFLIAPKDTSFVTSDNPCFTISPTKIMNGLLSPNSKVIFPLRPDICIYIKPGVESKTEHFIKLDKKQVKEINKLILQNSYQCLVAKSKTHLESLTKHFDHMNHRKSRNITIRENADYTMFNVE